MTTQRRLLGLYAHPDDEILSPGGTIAHYTVQGVHIEWVCATRGEAGEISAPSLATPDNLGDVREREMLCAAQTLGIEKVHFLGYRDSGMAGSEDNDRPDAYANSDANEVVPRLVALIRRIRPHIILTFEPFGGYGHPDHITIHRHTHAAIAAAADPTYRSDLGSIWETPRLFYPLLRIALFMKIKKWLAARDMDLSFFDRLEERRERGWPDDKYHCRIDITQTFAQKWAAFHCHATQFGPNNLFRQLPESEMAALFTHEYFALARPEPAANARLQDLFDGLEL
jgi:LmbE family N-acetylglucosaminyl deacetylase